MLQPECTQDSNGMHTPPPSATSPTGPGFHTEQAPDQVQAARLSLKSTSSSTSITSRHSKYYFDDTLSVFLVEGTLFRVHRHFLIRESGVFKWMFANLSDDDGKQGDTDTNPIVLTDVQIEEFESLLDFFYNGMHDHLGATAASQKSRQPPKTPLSTSSPQHLMNLLAISTRFEFDRIRQYATDELQRITPTLDPIDVILLAEKHDVFHWIAPALSRLCQRDQPLTVPEARKLGFETAILVAEAREILHEVHSGMKHSDLKYDPKIVSRVIDDTFFEKNSTTTAPRVSNPHHTRS